MIHIRLFVSTYIYYHLVGAVDYCTLSCDGAENSGCKCDIGQACGGDVKKLAPNSEDRQYIVKVHNDARELVASEEGAGNIVALVYDNDVEYVAQCYANQCIAAHDTCRKTEAYPLVGQNFFMSAGGTSCDDKAIFKVAADMWFDERKDADGGCIQSYTGCSGHYTQMVWATTETVGCGRVLFNGQCHVFCNYGPAGNMMGSPVYQQGSLEGTAAEGYPHLLKPKKSTGDANKGINDALPTLPSVNLPTVTLPSVTTPKLPKLPSGCSSTFKFCWPVIFSYITIFINRC